MPGPWERYAQQTAPANPVIAPPDPYKQANEQRAQVDQSLQLEAAGRAREDQQFQREKFAIESQRAERQEQRAQAGTVDEKKIATLVTRLATGLNTIEGIEETDPNAERPGFVEGLRGDLMPGGVGGMVTRAVAGPNRRTVADAQRDMLDSLLTLGTGAAYNAEQLSAMMAGYFPQYNDTPQEATAKRARLEALIEAAKTNAGPAWANVEPLVERYLGAGAPARTGGNAAAQRDDPFPGIVGEDGKPLPPEGGYGFDPKTGEWGLYGGQVSDDTPSPYDPGGPLAPDGKPRITGNDPAYAQFAAGVGDIVEGGLNNTVGLIANPVNTNLFRALGYEGFTSDIGRSAREGLGLPYGNETIGAINQAAAGGISAAGGARQLGNALGQGMSRNALLEYGQRPMLDAVTGGAAATSGELARQAGAGPVGQTAAIIAGGATPSAVMGSRNALLNIGRGGNPPPDFDPSVVQAGQRQNIPIRQPDAVPSRRGDTAALETSARGGPIIQQARANDNALIEQRVESLGGEGSALDPYPLGQKVQGAGNRYIDRTRGQKNERYVRAEQLAKGQRISPQQAISAVDRNIAELEASGANTNSAVIGYLRELRGDLSKADGFSITEFQALRSAANKKIRGDNALTVSDADRRLSDVVQAFSADAGEQLPESASAALKEADQFYSQRQDFINGVLRNVMGTRGNPLPAERAAERLIAMTKGKGDYDRFSRMWGELSTDEKSDVAATLAMSLGRKANGEFSVSTLIRSLDPRSGVNPRTARLIFGADGARALSDLRTIAQAKTATATALNNSRTGTVVNRVGGGLKTLLWGSLGLQTGGVGGAIAAPVARDLLAKWGEERAARALMNPTFTKWLREAPEATNPQAINAYFKRLEVQAAKSPILAQDVRGLQEALADAFSQSPGRAAAQQEND